MDFQKNHNLTDDALTRIGLGVGREVEVPTKEAQEVLGADPDEEVETYSGLDQEELDAAIERIGTEVGELVSGYVDQIVFRADYEIHGEWKLAREQVYDALYEKVREWIQ